MRLRISAIFGDAFLLWRENRDLLMRVSAVFLFLPLLAARLFIAVPEVAEDTPERMWAAIGAFYAANWHWATIIALLQAYGSAALLVLLLDSSRPALGGAMARALALLPALVVASIGAWLLMTLGMLLLIVPGLYLIGRCFVTGPVLVAGPSRNPFAAIAESIRLTRGNGWVLFFVSITVSMATLLLSGVFDGVEAGTVGGVPVLGALLAVASAAVGTAGSLALVLVHVAAYRLLVSRQGI
jgi:hypothetical protein